MIPESTNTPDWSQLPVPQDDGATDHLKGLKMPSIALTATDGATVDLSQISGKVIVYAYPRTGQPGISNPDGWEMVPGARGCSPQSCAFRDHFDELKSLGISRVYGLSTQDSEYQLEAVQRLHLPFPILSDEKFMLTHALKLPTFDIAGMTLLKRFTLLIENGVITHVFYPVFPPDRNPVEIKEYLHIACAG